MDPVDHQKEMTAILARAKRAGMTVHHYPESHLAILRMQPPAPPPPLAATDIPPVVAPVAPSPQ